MCDRFMGWLPQGQLCNEATGGRQRCAVYSLHVLTISSMLQSVFGHHYNCEQAVSS